jgi:hypothetical protein
MSFCHSHVYDNLLLQWNVLKICLYIVHLQRNYLYQTGLGPNCGNLLLILLVGIRLLCKKRWVALIMKMLRWALTYLHVCMYECFHFWASLAARRLENVLASWFSRPSIKQIKGVKWGCCLRHALGYFFFFSFFPDLRTLSGGCLQYGLVFVSVT